MSKLCKVKVRTFEANSGIDYKINNFINAKNKDGDNFKIIDIQYRPLKAGNYGFKECAMIIYEDYDMDDYNLEGE